MAPTWQPVPMIVVGVDACTKGWVAVAMEPEAPPRAVVVDRLDDLSDMFPDAAGFGIDIPIGLLADGPRQADLQAREVLGPRRHSVFMTPIRAALLADTHAEATAISTTITGKGISRQAYGLRHRILETEAWLDRAPAPVWEVHPEVSFTRLLGRPPAASKKTWAGMVERRDALDVAGIVLDDLGVAGTRAATDDVLDAAVVAWSAARLVAGDGRSLPDPPEQDPVTGRAIAIWV
jgi:predicted RNase H-like nuclease